MNATKFYSSKLKHDVSVPDGKVCGYRTGNNATKKGWSSLVRAGKNNGVVKQTLSRFSTDAEADDVQPCAGNRNWLNANQRLQFNKTRGGSAFEIKRPAYRSGKDYRDIDVPPLDVNERDGMGNYDITRLNFIAPPIKGRYVIPFETLQAQDIEFGGIKVQLGQKTLDKLFKIQVDDPTDKNWLDEYERRLRAGETEEQLKLRPPLGRPQRKITKMTSIDGKEQSLTDKIETVYAAINQGYGQSTQQRAALMLKVKEILGNQDDSKQQDALNDLLKKSDEARQQLEDILRKIGMTPLSRSSTSATLPPYAGPQVYQTNDPSPFLGLTTKPPFLDKDAVKRSSAALGMYLMGTIPPELSDETPIWLYTYPKATSGPQSLPPQSLTPQKRQDEDTPYKVKTKLSYLFRKMSNQQWFNIMDRSIYSLKELVSRNGGRTLWKQLGIDKKGTNLPKSIPGKFVEFDDKAGGFVVVDTSNLPPISPI